MSWNYRVIEFVDQDAGPWRAIHAVYYDEAGRPSGYAEEPAAVVSCDPEGNEADLGWVLDRMRDALSKATRLDAMAQKWLDKANHYEGRT